MNRAGVVLGAVLVVSFAVDARAGDPMEDYPDPDAAKHLLAEGRVLMQKKRFDEACEKLEESVRLEAVVEAQLDLADCHEHVGRLASAWGGFSTVADKARAAKQKALAKSAGARAKKLERRVPKLLLAVPESLTVPGLEVKRNGVVIEASAWAKPIPVDPGAHKVTVTAPGMQRWLVVVRAEEGATVRAELPADLVPVPPPPPPDPGPEEEEPKPAEPAPETVAEAAPTP